MGERYYNSHYYYIHNVFGCFINGIADFLKNSLFDESTEVVIGTYSKALQHFTNLQNDGGDRHDVKYPFISVDPNLDFEPDDRLGVFLYNYPEYNTELASNVYNPIFDDGNVVISPVLNRYMGTMEVTVWTRSVYEYMDLRVLAYQFFAGGRGRVVYPRNISGYFIMPDEFMTYEYNNRYTGEKYSLDWSNNKAENIIIKTINQNKWVYPFELTPWLKLDGVSDMSEKYGGDSLSEYKLGLTIGWEVNLPTHLLMKVRENPIFSTNCYFEINTDIVYKFPTTGNTVSKFKSHIIGSPADTPTEVITRDVEYKDRVNYVVTESDITELSSDNPFYISLGESVSDVFMVEVFHKGKPLSVGYDYDLVDTNSIKIIPINLKDKIESNDLIDIFIYQEESN